MPAWREKTSGIFKGHAALKFKRVGCRDVERDFGSIKMSPNT